MVVALAELDLELDAAEERRGRVEDEPVAGRARARRRAARGRPRRCGARRRRLAAVHATRTPAAGLPAPVSSTWVESEAITAANLLAWSTLGARDLRLVGADERAALDDELAADVEAVGAERRRRGRARRRDPARRRARARRSPRRRGRRTCPARSRRGRPARARRRRRASRSAAPRARSSPRPAARRARRAAPASRRSRGRCARSRPSRRRRARRGRRRRASRAPARRRRRAGGWRSGSARRPCRSRRSGRSPAPRGGRSARTRRRRRASRGGRGTRPACSRRARGRTASSSTVSARCVWSCSPSSARELSRLASSGRPVTENGRARRDGDLDACARAGLVQRRRAARVSSRMASIVLDDGVGRQAALRDAEVHRAARGDDADAELLRRLHLRLDEPLAAAREDVVVVEDGAAAGEQQLGEAGAGGGVLGLGVDARPGGVELDEPLEERRLLARALASASGRGGGGC